MKPPPFDYLDPPDLEGVLAALHTHGDDAAVIGGGQSLVPLLNLRLARPEVVIVPRRVAGLDSVVVTDQRIEVGARVTATDLLDRANVARAVPGLREAIHDIGHVQIRNRTTIGGTIAHADPAAELPAVLLGLDGSVVLQATSGARVVAAGDFFLGPFSTARRPDELVTGVRFEVPAGRTGWLEQARRPGDFALVGVFAALALSDDGQVSSVAIALSGVGGRPVRAAGAEAQLLGRAPTAETVAEAAEIVRREVRPTDDVHATAAHRTALAGVLTRRLLTRLAGPLTGRPRPPT